MFNFLNSKLLPKVKCNVPCTENYEIENLISDQYVNRLRGFIAYPSIKPPIEIEFEFLCNVNIHYVFLNTSVGNQKCSGVEILAKSSNTPFVSIGKAYYDTQGVIFCNSRKYSKESPPPCFNTNFSLYFFKGSFFRIFLNASNLKVVIFRTEKSVPCIASVEIWGIPSKNCSQKTVETLHRLMGHKVLESGDSNVNHSIANLSDNSTDIFQIPDDFKDDLTYELMAIPYTLPSGKTIDQTTLEKHQESEKSFGRKPCDPFTGVKFTDKLKPILNVGLKSRIDMFLLENSHRTETFSLKRNLRTENFVNKRPRQEFLGESSSNEPAHKRLRPEFLGESSSNESEHHTRPRDDLDSLIAKAKSNTNFLSFLNEDQRTLNTCNFCKDTFQYLYELPCSHHYCRSCLLEICKDCICKICKKSFVKSNVIKRDF